MFLKLPESIEDTENCLLKSRSSAKENSQIDEPSHTSYDGQRGRVFPRLDAGFNSLEVLAERWTTLKPLASLLQRRATGSQRPAAQLLEMQASCDFD